MNSDECAKAGERTVLMLRANTWAYNFLGFALLFDIMYRTWVFHEGAWDLFALLGVSGVIGMVYAARHRVLIINRKRAIYIALLIVVSAVVTGIIAFIKAR